MAGYIILCLKAFTIAPPNFQLSIFEAFLHRPPAPSLRGRAGGEAMYLLPLEGVRGLEFVTYSDVINIGLPIGEGRVRS